jgi:hypothetical protein
MRHILKAIYLDDAPERSMLSLNRTNRYTEIAIAMGIETHDRFAGPE